MSQVKLDDLADAVRIDTFKEIITEVARTVRRELLEEKELSSECSVLSLASLARIVLYNKSKMAARLISKSEMAAEHLRVHNGIVFFACQSSFDAALALAKLHSFDEQRSTLDHINLLQPSDATKRRIESLENKSRLWKKGASKLILCGVYGNDGEVLTSKSQMGSKLRQDWGPTFQALPDLQLQEQALRELRPYVFDATELWDALAPPGSCMFLWKAEHAKPTKPGPDTIAYAAWASLAGAYTLLLLFFSRRPRASSSTSATAIL